VRAAAGPPRWIVTPGDEDRLTDYSEDGVDLTLIRWMLSLTPAERLEVLQSHLNRIIAIRELNAAK
jgi:hypothetical protein